MAAVISYFILVLEVSDHVLSVGGRIFGALNVTAEATSSAEGVLEAVKQKNLIHECAFSFYFTAFRTLTFPTEKFSAVGKMSHCRKKNLSPEFCSIVSHMEPLPFPPGCLLKLSLDGQWGVTGITVLFEGHRKQNISNQDFLRVKATIYSLSCRFLVLEEAE